MASRARSTSRRGSKVPYSSRSRTVSTSSGSFSMVEQWRGRTGPMSPLRRSTNAPSRQRQLDRHPSLLKLLPDRVHLLARLGDRRVEVAAVIGEDAGRAAVEDDERLQRRRGDKRARDLIEERREDLSLGERLRVLALEGAHAVTDHVGVALRVVEEVVGLPRPQAVAAELVAVELGVGVAEEVAPRHEEPQQLHVALRDRLRGAERRLEAADVLVQKSHALAVAALRRRKPQPPLVIAEHEIRLHEVGIEGVARHLRQVVLHDAHGLAYRLDDAELTIGVVVGPERRSPEDEVVGTPAEAVAQLVVDDRAERRRQHGAGRRRLADGKMLREIERQLVVAHLSEMEGDDREHPNDEQANPAIEEPPHAHAAAAYRATRVTVSRPHEALVDLRQLARQRG